MSACLTDLMPVDLGSPFLAEGGLALGLGLAAEAGGLGREPDVIFITGATVTVSSRLLVPGLREVLRARKVSDGDLPARNNGEVQGVVRQLGLVTGGGGARLLVPRLLRRHLLGLPGGVGARPHGQGAQRPGERGPGPGLLPRLGRQLGGQSAILKLHRLN